MAQPSSGTSVTKRKGTVFVKASDVPTIDYGEEDDEEQKSKVSSQKTSKSNSNMTGEVNEHVGFQIGGKKKASPPKENNHTDDEFNKILNSEMEKQKKFDKDKFAEVAHKKELEIESSSQQFGNIEDVEEALNQAFNGKDMDQKINEIPTAPKSARVKIEIPDVKS